MSTLTFFESRYAFTNQHVKVTAYCVIHKKKEVKVHYNRSYSF